MIDVIGSERKSRPNSIGILLLNTGTPDDPTPSAVRRFLAEFLSDKKVIYYPRWLWLPLLYGVILNVRPRRSARMYHRIWGAEGSPLLTITQSLRDKLHVQLADSIPGYVQVEFAMRYGNPSIPNVLSKFQQSRIDHLIILPLFPQFSGTTTGTTVQRVFDSLKSWNRLPSIQVISDYHQHPAYIGTLAESIRSNATSYDKLLFSFHGIPQRYVDAGDPYETQCRRSASLVAEKLGLQPQGWQVAFQSRFGPEAWTQPYTDQVLESLGNQGVAKLRVVCPGFAIDCLETLDEIEHEGRKTFQLAGGGEFSYIPALNDTNAHVNALTEIILNSCYAHVA